jgi:hypothetical protein
MPSPRTRISAKDRLLRVICANNASHRKYPPPSIERYGPSKPADVLVIRPVELKIAPAEQVPVVFVFNICFIAYL